MRLLILSVFIASAGYAQSGETVKLDINEVVNIVSERNYEVLEEALKTYQAKESIKVARAGLLPSLNIWKAASAVIDPAALYGMIRDIVPFLVPSNWFRLKQNKQLYLVKNEGYRALWANQVMTAKGLYYQALLDRSLLATINEVLEKVAELETMITTRERLGYLPAGSSLVIKDKRKVLESDRMEMALLVRKDERKLTMSLGLDASTQLDLTSVSPLPDDIFQPIDSDLFEFRMLDVSPEYRQYDHLLKVVPSIKKEIYYGFLGASSSSRGTAGGIFDDLPESDGLGFGLGPQVRIVSTQAPIFEKQRQAVEQILKRNLQDLVDEWNADLTRKDNFEQRLKDINEEWRLVKSRLNLGKETNLLEITNILERMMGVKAAQSAIRTRFYQSKDRLDRMLFAGDYTKEPANIEEIRNGMVQR